MTDMNTNMTNTAHSPAASGPSLLPKSVKLQLLLGAAVLIGASVTANALALPYWVGVVNLSILYLIASLNMRILLNDAGQVSFGQGAVFGAAAYAVGIACGMHGLSFGTGAILGLVGALAFGVLFALPALRVQWFYLGFVTLSGALVFTQLLTAFNSLTNGVSGISVPFNDLNAPWLFGMSKVSVMVLALGVVALCIAAVVPRTQLGRRMLVASVSPEAARSLGISPGGMRMTAFMLTALGTGMAGVLYPPTIGFVSPNAFSLDMSILFFFAVIVGGKGQLLGPMAGIVLLYLVPNVFFAHLVEYRTLVYGIVAFLVMMLMPRGIMGGIAQALIARRPPAPMPPLPFDAIFNRAGAAPKAAADAPPAIRVDNLTKTFGSVVAVNNVTLSIATGEIHGLVGANGSGKTSLLNVLNGFSPSNGGRVMLLGHDVTGMDARQIAKLGVGRTFQTPRIFEQMSAWDNIQIGLDADLGQSTLPAEFVTRLRAQLADLRIESVPHGQRRLLEVTRVILTGARILFLDEPAAGLSPDERVTFANLLRDLRDKLGLTIVIVEHDLDLVASIADRVTVLEGGAVLSSGDVASVWADPRVQSLLVSGGNDA